MLGGIPGIQQQCIDAAAVVRCQLKILRPTDAQGLPDRHIKLLPQLQAALGAFFSMQLQHLMTAARLQLIALVFAWVHQHQNALDGRIARGNGLPEGWALRRRQEPC